MVNMRDSRSRVSVPAQEANGVPQQQADRAADRGLAYGIAAELVKAYKESPRFSREPEQVISELENSLRELAQLCSGGNAATGEDET